MTAKNQSLRFYIVSYTLPGRGRDRERECVPREYWTKSPEQQTKVLKEPLQIQDINILS